MQLLYLQSEKRIAIHIVSWSKYCDTYRIVRWVYRCSPITKCPCLKCGKKNRSESRIDQKLRNSTTVLITSPANDTGMRTRVIGVGFYPVHNTSTIYAHRRWKPRIWMWVWYRSNVFGMKRSATCSDQIFRACIDAFLLNKTIELHIMLYSLKYHCV